MVAIQEPCAFLYLRITNVNNLTKLGMTETTTLHINGQDIPAKIIRERRSSVRAYIGKDHVILRFPTQLTEADYLHHRARMEAWLTKQFQHREGLTQRYEKADYLDGDTLRVGQRQYQLHIGTEARKTSSGNVKAGHIRLRLSHHLTPEQRSEAIRTLLSRLIADDYLPAITQRVVALNAQFFQKPIRSVRLKYNHSNWGSCSTSGNVNFSTRLLFAPPDVVDYVIIHELAHLVEMNHSDRFWRLVASAMPDYEAKEAWLKEFGAKCDF